MPSFSILNFKMISEPMSMKCISLIHAIVSLFLFAGYSRENGIGYKEKLFLVEGQNVGGSQCCCFVQLSGIYQL